MTNLTPATIQLRLSKILRSEQLIVQDVDGHFCEGSFSFLVYEHPGFDVIQIEPAETHVIELHSQVTHVDEKRLHPKLPIGVCWRPGSMAFDFEGGGSLPIGKPGKIKVRAVYWRPRPTNKNLTELPPAPWYGIAVSDPIELMVAP